MWSKVRNSCHRPQGSTLLRLPRDTCFQEAHSRPFKNIFSLQILFSCHKRYCVLSWVRHQDSWWGFGTRRIRAEIETQISSWGIVMTISRCLTHCAFLLCKPSIDSFSPNRKVIHSPRRNIENLWCARHWAGYWDKPTVTKIPWSSGEPYVL